jgi:hypothetical protein
MTRLAAAAPDEGDDADGDAALAGGAAAGL